VRRLASLEVSEDIYRKEQLADGDEVLTPNRSVFLWPRTQYLTSRHLQAPVHRHLYCRTVQMTDTADLLTVRDEVPPL
jgi:hypothetical protein